MLRIYHGGAAIVAAAALFLGGPASATTTCPEHYAGGVEPKLINAKLDRSTVALCKRSFALLHSGLTRTPLYVGERLTRASVAAARKYDQRDNRFHPEPRLPAGDRAQLRDYTRSGFDRGHMAPSGDMADAAADYDSFSLANIVPQAGGLNRNSWSDLEDYIRKLTTKLGAAYVVTGPLYEGTNIKALNGRVLVPTSVWKAIYVPGEGAGAWIATNAAAPRWQVVSVAELTSRAGIDPFPAVPAATKAKVSAFPNFGRGRAKRDR